MGEEVKKIAVYWLTRFMGIIVLKPLFVGQLVLFAGM